MSALDALREAVAGAAAVTPVGGSTHRDVGGPVGPTATEVRAPVGIVSYEPADMTVTVLAGTTVADLDAVLAEHGQECPIDAPDDATTVGGALASGLSGLRRLRCGPLRDRVLEVRFVTGDGRLVRGGGPTVKNVTGYDLPRLLVGSLGTLGVLGQVTLRTQPRPAASQWFGSADGPAALLAALFGPATVAWDGTRSYVRLEGHPDDVAAQAEQTGLIAGDGPAYPSGPHRGRVSVRPGALDAVAARLTGTGCNWLAEGGIGTVHVAAPTEDALAAARVAAEVEGGWLLREAGAPGLDPFGRPPANLALLGRIKDAFDPAGKLNPGRLPFLAAAA